jgi:nucleoside-diphosphate-sugar epimerase
MDVLVTGANGYCGRYIVAHLLGKGHHVAAVVRRPSNLGELFPSTNLIVIETDLVSPTGLPKKIDAIVHTAASLGIPGVADETIIHNNIGPLQPLLDYAQTAGASKFLFFSAISAYGTITTSSVNENTPIINPGSYGMSKLIGEQLLKGIEKSTPSISLRVPAIIGPDSILGWLDRVRLKMQTGKEVNYLNPNNPFNNVVHVQELAEFIGDILDSTIRQADICTLGAKSTITVKEMMDSMMETLKSSSKVIGKTDTSATAFTIDSSHAQKKFGWNPGGMANILERYLAENTA